MYCDDTDELAYLWTKIKFVKKYLNKNKSSSIGDAEKEFQRLIEGLMVSRIEQANKILNSRHSLNE